jgi:transcriptional regulator with XRE-family HTH domain
MNVVGKNVKLLREKRGMTQDQLAFQLEITGWKVDRFLISKIERGERQVTDKEVLLLADALHAKIKELFGRE